MALLEPNAVSDCVAILKGRDVSIRVVGRKTAPAVKRKVTLLVNISAVADSTPTKRCVQMRSRVVNVLCTMRKQVSMFRVCSSRSRESSGRRVAGSSIRLRFHSCAILI